MGGTPVSTLVARVNPKSLLCLVWTPRRGEGVRVDGALGAHADHGSPPSKSTPFAAVEHGAVSSGTGGQRTIATMNSREPISGAPNYGRSAAGASLAARGARSSAAPGLDWTAVWGDDSPSFRWAARPTRRYASGFRSRSRRSSTASRRATACPSSRATRQPKPSALALRSLRAPRPPPRPRRPRPRRGRLWHRELDGRLARDAAVVGAGGNLATTSTPARLTSRGLARERARGASGFPSTSWPPILCSMMLALPRRMRPNAAPRRAPG